MSQAEKTAVIEAILTRAADQLGDITPPVMKLYYQQFPDAKALFEHHGGHGIHNLEGDMVSQALYCLMWWFDSQGEIEFLLEKSVPHHSDELNVPKEHYVGFLNATAEVIQTVIPLQNSTERLVWDELCKDLIAVIDQQ